MPQVNGGIYVIRCTEKTRGFMAELIRRSAEAPGALHDQEHLNAMLGLSTAPLADPMTAVFNADDPMRYEILPDEQYIWAHNLLDKRPEQVCFHHAVATTGVATKVAQLASVRAALELGLRDGRVSRQLTSLRRDGCDGAGLSLRAYAEGHVPTVVGWQQSEPGLAALLGLEEPDNLDDEIEFVRRLARGDEPGTLCMAILLPAPAAHADNTAEAVETKEVACVTGVATQATPYVLAGTVSARLHLPESYPLLGIEGELPSAGAAALLASSLTSDAGCPPPLDVEVEVEIERTHRRRGLGRTAVELLLESLSRCLPEATTAVAKFPKENEAAGRFWEVAGFANARTCAALGQVELRRTPLSPSSPTAQWPAFYINLDSRADRRSQMETVLRRAGLRPQRMAARTLVDKEVCAAQQACPGKPAGWHANAASHAAIWTQIAASVGPESDLRAQIAVDPTTALQLHFIFEDDVVLHAAWVPMLDQLLRRLLDSTRQPSPGAGSADMPESVAASAQPVRAASEGCGCDPHDSVIDCVMLDGLFLSGELSATHGWLGPTQYGAHRAVGVGFSSAYALTPSAARWLLCRRKADPYHNAEAYLGMLQEERGRCWTHFPRLAIQRWDELASSVSELSPQAMRKWYQEQYFPRCPPCLYGL